MFDARLMYSACKVKQSGEVCCCLLSLVSNIVLYEWSYSKPLWYSNITAEFVNIHMFCHSFYGAAKVQVAVHFLQQG